LYPNSSYTYNYENIPEIVVRKGIPPGAETAEAALPLAVPFGPLAKAPRFDLATFSTLDICRGLGEGTLQDRLDEYEILYRGVPDPSWWGWNFWGVNYTRRAAVSTRIPRLLCDNKLKKNKGELHKSDLAIIQDCLKRKLS
jgi:hypothetical protein